MSRGADLEQQHLTASDDGQSPPQSYKTPGSPTSADSTPGRSRCEAGMTTRQLQRCPRLALPGERWCRQHHPAATPVTAHVDPAPALRSDRRLLEMQLAMQEQLRQLTAEVRALAARLDAAAKAEERAPKAAANGAGPVLLTVPQAAEILGLHRTTVYRMVADGDLPVVQVRGRVRLLGEDLAQYARRRREPAYRRQP